MFINISVLRRKQFYLVTQSVYLQYIFHKPKSPQDSTGLKGNQKDHVFTRARAYVCELHDVLLFMRTSSRSKHWVTVMHNITVSHRISMFLWGSGFIQICVHLQTSRTIVMSFVWTGHWTGKFYLPTTGGKRGTGATQSSAISLALLAISSCWSFRPWSSSSSSSAARLSRSFDKADSSSLKPLVLEWWKGWDSFRVTQTGKGFLKTARKGRKYYVPRGCLNK